ncbi:MAG: hypothetical protein LUD84_10860 [Clostridiales bacterium]|nr:hypothetical protein [Clostridiales bacterium]
MKNKTNREIRERMERGGFYYWQLAQAVGISSGNLTVWMRQELTGERLSRVLAALDKLEGVSK